MDKNDVNKMLEKMANNSGMPKPMSVEVWYDKKLQSITGTEFEPVIMGEGSSFLYLLQNIFMVHPQLEKKYPPGALGLTINGVPPRQHSVLFDGDKIMVTAG